MSTGFLKLKTLGDNEDAISLYLKLGFVIEVEKCC